jgi:thiaminase/transcriptional activator TenA
MGARNIRKQFFCEKKNQETFTYKEDKHLLAEFEAALPPLYQQLRNDCKIEWENYVNHPFVQQLANQTLPRTQFLNWMVQDYFYLIQYARAYALLAYKADTIPQMQSASTILHGLLHEEMSLHRATLDSAGIDLTTAKESLETLAYSRYIIDRAQSGDILDLLVTLSPCLAGYGEIGLRLIANVTLENHLYREWIETYAGPAYHTLLHEGLAQLESLAATHGATARYPLLLKQFRQSVQLETAFWNAGHTT